MAVSDETVVTWEEIFELSTGDPPWRTITEDEEGGLLIEIDPAKLNTGLIPTAEGKGHYSSQEEFLERQSILLGINIVDVMEEDRPLTIVQLSASQKFEVDNDDEVVRMLPSSGDFVIDTLTTDDGAIYIDGERYDPPTHESTFVEGDEQSGSSTSGFSTMAYGDNGHVPFNSEAGNWSAKLTGDYDRDYFPWIGRDWFSAIYDFERNGKQTSRDCKWFFWTDWRCETNHVNAKRLLLYNAYVFTGDFILVNDDGVVTSYGYEDDEVRKSNKDEMRVSESDWFGGIEYSDMCAKAIIRDNGYSNGTWGHTNFSGLEFSWGGTECWHDLNFEYE